MRVLGINAVFHDPVAAVAIDGKVVAAAEEERFSRRKHGKRPVPFSTWELPELAARWCLAESGIDAGDLDAIAYSYDAAPVRPGQEGLDPGWEALRTRYADRAPQQESYWGNVNPIGPRSVYDEAKRYAEALTTAFRTSAGAVTGIVRIFNTYGPRMRPRDGRMVPTFIRPALTGEPLTVAGDGTQTRSICYVDDTVQGILALAGSDFPGPVNIGNPAEMSVLELARLIRDLTGSASPVRHVPRPQDDPSVRCPDTSLAAGRLGWRPSIDPVDGLRRSSGASRDHSLRPYFYS